MDSWEWLRFFTQIELFLAATKEKNFKSSKTYSEESIWINKATRVRVVKVNQLQKNPMLLCRGRRWNFTTGYALFLYRAEGIYLIFLCAVVLWWLISRCLGLRQSSHMWLKLVIGAFIKHLRWNVNKLYCGNQRTVDEPTPIYKSSSWLVTNWLIGLKSK